MAELEPIEKLDLLYNNGVSQGLRVSAVVSVVETGPFHDTNDAKGNKDLFFFGSNANIYDKYDNFNFSSLHELYKCAVEHKCAVFSGYNLSNSGYHFSYGKHPSRKVICIICTSVLGIVSARFEQYWLS